MHQLSPAPFVDLRVEDGETILVARRGSVGFAWDRAEARDQVVRWIGGDLVLLAPPPPDAR